MITSEIAAYSHLRLGRNLADVDELEDFVDKSFIAREIFEDDTINFVNWNVEVYRQSYKHTALEIYLEIRDRVYTIFIWNVKLWD